MLWRAAPFPWKGRKIFRDRLVGKRELFSVLPLGGGAVLSQKSPLGQAHVDHENDWAVAPAQLFQAYLGGSFPVDHLPTHKQEGLTF